MFFTRHSNKTTSSQNSTPTRSTKKRRLDRAVRSVVESLETRTLFSFSAPVPYAASPATLAMISVDANADGHADIVTYNSAAITVLPGNGDGTFGAALVSPLNLATAGSPYTGSQAGTFASGDFNGDGKLDLVAVAGNNAAILLGNGDGSFQAPIQTSLGNSPVRLSTADVNGDGITDIVAANTFGMVSVLIGAGNGAFSAPVYYAAGPSPQDVKVADMNHDGKADLLVADAVSAGSVSVLMGNGDGTFQAYKSYAAFSAPYRMTLDDFNNDGNPDVAVANSYTSSCVTILYGNPDGSLQPYHSYDTGSQPWELDAADIDGDGKADLISSNGSSYQIELNNGDGTFAPTVNTPGAGLAFAAADFNGDGVADVAGANLSNVGVMINQAVAATNISTAVGFSISAPAATTAGAPLPVTISAVDASGNPVPAFLGTVHIATTDPRLPSLTYTFTPADAGTHTLAGIALYTAGPQTLTISGLQLAGSTTTVNVASAAASRFNVSADAASIAGAPISLTVTTADAFGNGASNFTGTINFSSNDPQATLPASYTFTSADNGVHTFSATLRTAGAITINARDAANPLSAGSSTATLVTAAAATSLSLVGGGGHIGSPHTVTVSAFDAFGNIATGYTGTLALSASDAAAVIPAQATITNGIAYFTFTPMTLGTQTLSIVDATNPALSGTETIVGTPGDAVRFAVTPISSAVAGTVQSVTVTAYDAFGNVQVDYAGSVLFTSSDYQASLPFYTFTAADAGTHTFSIALKTAGTQSLTVRDYYNNAVASSTQSGIVVTAGTATSLTVTPLTTSVAGVAQSFTATARDIYGNVASSFRDTLTFVSSDAQATLLPSYTFTAADAGTHTFSITMKSSGGQTFTVSDAANAAMSSFQNDINVSASTMVGFSINTPSNIAAGVAFTVKLVAVDAYGNTVSGYTGKVHFTASTGGNVLPADYTFTAADNGVHLFTMTLNSTGSVTLKVTDTVASTLAGNSLVNVRASGGGGGGGGGSTSTGGGGTATGGGGTSTGGGGTATGGGGTGGGKKVP